MLVQGCAHGPAVGRGEQHRGPRIADAGAAAGAPIVGPERERSTVIERRDVRPDDAFLAPVDQRTDLLPAGRCRRRRWCCRRSRRDRRRDRDRPRRPRGRRRPEGLGPLVRRGHGRAATGDHEARHEDRGEERADAPCDRQAAAGRGRDSGDLPPRSRGSGIVHVLIVDRVRLARVPGARSVPEAERVEHGELVEQPEQTPRVMPCDPSQRHRPPPAPHPHAGPDARRLGGAASDGRGCRWRRRDTLRSRHAAGAHERRVRRSQMPVERHRSSSRFRSRIRCTLSPSRRPPSSRRRRASPRWTNGWAQMASITSAWSRAAYGLSQNTSAYDWAVADEERDRPRSCEYGMPAQAGYARATSASWYVIRTRSAGGRPSVARAYGTVKYGRSPLVVPRRFWSRRTRWKT